MISANVFPIKHITLAPSPFVAGWWMISICTGKSCRPLGFANNHATAVEAGRLLAVRFKASFAPPGNIKATQPQDEREVRS